MTSDYLAVLDACVIVPAGLRDTLLRLAETPRLFVPKWSDEILAEVRRTLIGSSARRIARLTIWSENSEMPFRRPASRNARSWKQSSQTTKRIGMCWLRRFDLRLGLS